MNKNDYPDLPSDEVDLAAANEFEITHPTYPDHDFSGTQSTVHPNSNSVEAFDEEEFEIPAFLQKNKSADIAAYENEKFVNRSMKMVQDAVRTLAEDNKPIGETGQLAGMSSHEMANQNASAGMWKLIAIISAFIIGTGGYIAYQSGNMDSIASFAQNVSFAQKQDSLLQPDINSDTVSPKSSALFGNSSTGGSNDLAQSGTVETASTNKAIKLNGDQYNSLKARLGGDRIEQPANADAYVAADNRRLQVAALVAEQAPDNLQSTISLNKATEVARKLDVEVEVAKTTAEMDNTTIQQQRNSSPTQPLVQLAQVTTSANDKLKQLTSKVVDQLTKLKNFEENPETVEIPETQDLRNSINQLVQQAASQNLDSSAIEGLLQDALENSNAVPQALARADGKLDIRLLLMGVLSQVDSSQVKSGDEDYLSALDDEGATTVIQSSQADTPILSELDNTRVKLVDGKKTIVVEIGDTLSKIAFAIYGEALAYTRIYKANRKQLKNPNLLKIGMTLKLP